ncbi:MAG: hypothetical protein U0X40_00150 [Ferruginibacter sp.]
MTSQYYITASVSIGNGLVCKNNQPVFRLAEPDPGLFLAAAYRHFGWQYPKFHKMDNLSRLGWLGAELLLDEEFQQKAYPPGSVGVVLANANASLDTDIRYYDTVKQIPSPALFVYTLPNIVTGEICIRHKLKGENAFFIQEDFDAAFIEQYVRELVNNTIVEACICGWVELLNKQYKTVLFLIEKEAAGTAIPLTVDALTKTYQSENG